MISIRTTLVVAAFVGMGLTSAAEYLARTVLADPEPFVTVGTEEAVPAKTLRLTQRAPVAPVVPDDSPWL